MPGKHAKLSPSAAERWTTCPASIRMASKVPEAPESPYAGEGTAAHALAELKVRRAFEWITSTEYNRERRKWREEFAISSEVELEMDLHTDDYVALIKERMSLFPNSELRLEQRLSTGIPECDGTSDAVISSPVHIEIIDFKYGAGVAVEAHGNPQLRLYGVGALLEYGPKYELIDDVNLIRITVHQPRMDHTLTDEMTPEELLAWRDSIIPIAEEALGDNARFNPSEDACRWCPASGRCTAQLQAAFPDDLDDADPDVLTPEQIAVQLDRLPQVKVWIAALEKVGLHKAYSEGQAIPGYKVIRSGGKRSVKDHEGAIDALVGQGLSEDDVSSRKAKGIGELEKLCKANELSFAELLEAPGFVVKGEGQPSLVLESAAGEPIRPEGEATKVFNDDLD